MSAILTLLGLDDCERLVNYSTRSHMGFDIRRVRTATGSRSIMLMAARISGQTPPSKSPSTYGDVLRGPRCPPNKDSRSMEDLMQTPSDHPSGGHRVNDHGIDY